MKSPSKLIFETILVIAVAVAVLASPLMAQAGERPHGPPALADWDSDGDGFLSEDEFNKGRAERHAAMAEAGRPMKGMESAPTFADIDSDDDGKLSTAEFTAAHEKHMAEMRKMHDGKGMHHKHRRAHASFEDIDTNGDGCIDKAELEAHHAMEKSGQQ
jgi:Ca2+-binding EF-hand superfamily protein